MIKTSRKDVRATSVHNVGKGITLYGECNPPRALSTVERACALLTDSSMLELTVKAYNDYLSGSGLTLSFGEKYWDTWRPETGTTALELDYYVRLSSGKGEKDCHGPGGRGFSNSDIRCSSLEQVDKVLRLVVQPFMDEQHRKEMLALCANIGHTVNIYQDDDGHYLVSDSGMVICRGDDFDSLWEEFNMAYLSLCEMS